MKNLELAKEVILLATKKKIKIATNESCTGGCLINLLTSIEGSSSVVKGGFVAYSNEQKVKLGVSEKVLDVYSVYSRECACEMGRVARETITGGIEIGIGVTGTLSNVDIDNLDTSISGEVFFCINTKEVFLVKKISVPITERFQQKSIICYHILNELKAYLISL